MLTVPFVTIPTVPGSTKLALAVGDTILFCEHGNGVHLSTVIVNSLDWVFSYPMGAGKV